MHSPCVSFSRVMLSKQFGFEKRKVSKYKECPVNRSKRWLLDRLITRRGVFSMNDLAVCCSFCWCLWKILIKFWQLGLSNTYLLYIFDIVQTVRKIYLLKYFTYNLSLPIFFGNVYYNYNSIVVWGSIEYIFTVETYVILLPNELYVADN